MSMVTKKIGNREYVYLAYRSGKKIIQKYLGPASDPEIEKKKKAREETKRIPERFYALFWDVDPRRVDIKQHARYIIERVLEMGGLDALFWIQRVYPTGLIIETNGMSRKISARSRNFWNIWFGAGNAY